MNIDEYWELIGLIDTAALMRNDDVAALRPLQTEFNRLSENEQFSFYEHMVRRLYALNREEIRNAFEFGRSGEGFIYHRLYVIGRGRKFYSDFLDRPHYLSEQHMSQYMLYALDGFFDFCCENDIGTNNPEPKA